MLKDKKIVRRLALVLCLSLIVGVLPIGVLGVPVVVSTPPSEPVNVLVENKRIAKITKEDIEKVVSNVKIDKNII